uniref:Uncharacterized protein n=1 Tax=Rhizophora mucronata TaxID=61149 RepID=A0A2P2NCP9_RHIMU
MNDTITTTMAVPVGKVVALDEVTATKQQGCCSF